MKKQISLFIILGLLSLHTTVQAEQAAEKKEDKIKTGVIASTGTTAQSASINVDTSGSSPGDEVSAISGSVSRVKRNECVARVLNNGTKTYAVSFAVEGINKRGLKTLSKSYSATIAPKGVAEKNVSGCNEDLDLYVNLKSAKAKD